MPDVAQRLRAMKKVDSEQEMSFCECVVQSDLHAIRPPKDTIISELERLHYSECDIFGVKLALEEALTNAVRHGNQNDANKKVTVRYSITSEKAVVIVRDEGEGFLPEAVPDCTCPERLPVPSGRGILLMRAYMDKVCYRDHGREVYFVKRRTPPEGGKKKKKTAGAVRRTIYFGGRVQGVGFRFSAESIASRFAVAGYVRNLPDGRVELVAEGDKPELDRFQGAVEQAMADHIKDTQACDGPACGEYLSFRIMR